MERIYLDNAASSPLLAKVKEKMTEAFEHCGNPSSIHSEGRTTRTIVEDARKEIAQHLKCSIGELYFTSGGTEANNTILKNAVRDLGVVNMITSPIEHHCVKHSIERLALEGVKVQFVELHKSGKANLESLERLLKNNKGKTLVSLMHANNELGTLNDLEVIGNLCHKHDALFHTDSVQTIGKLPFDLSKLPIDFLSASAHKFHGPKGVGFFYMHGDHIFQPYMHGGSQERNMRAGTENTYGIAGMHCALIEAENELENRKEYIQALKSRFLNGLLELNKNVRINGGGEASLHSILSVSFVDTEKSDLLVFNLDIHGISVSSGSACSSGAETNSYVLEELNLIEGYKTIRFSFSHLNTEEQIDKTLAVVKSVL